jgi:hypothetical protein
MPTSHNRMYKEPLQGPASKEESIERAKEATAKFSRRGDEVLSMRLTGEFRWPAQFTTLNLEGRECLLWPKTRWDQPSIIVHCKSAQAREEVKLAMRFLSAIAWTQRAQIDHVGWWTCGSHSNPSFRDKPIEAELWTSDRFYLDEHDYIPMPKDDKARVASLCSAKQSTSMTTATSSSACTRCSTCALTPARSSSRGSTQVSRR